MSYLIWIVDLAALFLTAISLKQLDDYREAFISAGLSRRLRLAILSLVVGSLLAVGTIVVVIILTLRSDMLLRFAHTLLALGFWVIITSSLMAFMFRFRLNREVSRTAIAGLAAAVVLVLIVTPLSVFMRAFGPAEYDVPLVTGAATIGVCLILLLWLLFRLRPRR